MSAATGIWLPKPRVRMSNPLKLTLYVVLVILASVSGYHAFQGFARLMNKGERTSELERIDREERPAPAQPAPEAVTAGSTNVPQSEAANTNLPEAASGLAVSTNSEAAAAIETNAPAEELEAVQTEAAPSVPTALGKPAAEEGGSRMGLSLGVFLISILGLGILIARDVSHFMGNRALEVIYNDDGEGVKNPDYEAAEKVWTNGDHLEAIRMMREYLNNHPREQFVAIRIAEIYEKDLGNHLAAALEYEEVLKHKLPPERWGWAAIHLCNLYFKLNKEDKAHELLRRIVKDYGSTAAAEKARKRLEQVDGANYQLPTNDEVRPSTPAAPAARSESSNLPPGFRPKK